MGKVCVTEEYLQDIADAIREKGVEGTFTPAQMGDAVRQISGGGGVYHLDNKKIAQADPAEYITTPLDIDMVAGKWYQVNIRDVSESESETHVIEWNESETFDWGTGKQLLITSTTAGLSYYSGYWRDIYCDIIAIGEVYPNE